MVAKRGCEAAHRWLSQAKRRMLNPNDSSQTADGFAVPSTMRNSVCAPLSVMPLARAKHSRCMRQLVQDHAQEKLEHEYGVNPSAKFASFIQGFTAHSASRRTNVA